MEVKKIKPTADRLIVKPLAAEEVSKGGIIIPDQAKEKPSRGEVVAVGPGIKGIPVSVNIGDRVIYSQYAGTELLVNEEKHLMMREGDIYATY